MSGVRLTGDWKKFSNMLGKTLTKMQHTETLSEAFGEALVSSTRERFETGKRPDGTDWDESKRVKAQGGQTLVDTGILKNSIGYEATRDTVTIGTAEVYGAIHQFGGQAGRGRKVIIPERAYLGINDDDKEELKGITEDFIKEGLS